MLSMLEGMTDVNLGQMCGGAMKPYKPNAHNESPNPRPRKDGDQGMEIPKVLHFFWSGGKIRETEIKNLMTFLFNTDAPWVVNVWTDKAENITKPLTEAGVKLDRTRIRVREYWDTVEQSCQAMVASLDPNSHGGARTSEITHEDELFWQQRADLNMTRDTLYRLSVGLSQPAAVKDLFVPFVLFLEGGYYFDLDNYAHHQLKAMRAPRGFVVSKDCAHIDAFASLPGSRFWVDVALKLPELLKKLDTNQLDLNRFQLIEMLKDKSKDGWKKRLMDTTGQMYGAVYKERIEKEGSIDNKRRYSDEVNFRFFERTCGCQHYRSLMGVSMRPELDDTSGWRKRRNPKRSFDDTSLDDQLSRDHTPDSYGLAALRQEEGLNVTQSVGFKKTHR